MASVESLVEVAIAYALPERQVVLSVAVPAGTHAVDAVSFSGLLKMFPQLRSEELRLGVFGRPVPHDYVVASGDRIEIYRPLLADPKAVRRNRADRARSERGVRLTRT